MINKSLPIDVKRITKFKSILDLVIHSKSTLKKIAQKNMKWMNYFKAINLKKKQKQFVYNYNYHLNL